MLVIDELVARILEVRTHSGQEAFREIVGEVSQLHQADALVVWLKALSKNVDDLLVRLEVSRLLWQLDCLPMALEQLQRIDAKAGNSGSQAVRKLIESLGGDVSVRASTADADMKPEAGDKTIASVDFDIELIENDKDN